MYDSQAVANLHDRADLVGLARSRSRPTERISVPIGAAEDYAARGWEVAELKKRVAILARAKAHGRQLEDRVWTLLWRMSFPVLSGDGGAQLRTGPAGSRPTFTQMDVVALDDEVCIAVECKSSERRARRPDFHEELAKLAVQRPPLAHAVRLGRKRPKRSVALVLWTSNAVLSANDKERAGQHKITLLDENDLAYYEALVAHLGPAARFLFLADLLPERQIPGLAIRVPALASRMGGYRCFTFSAAPEYLMKIAYVSHRFRGATSDVATYQRMLSRRRLRQIADYIRRDPDAMFPTNIVISLASGRRDLLLFEPTAQIDEAQSGELGWLTLRPTYKAAWIIDGQHRLYAYSLAGPERAARDQLTVLAFEGLPGSVQQKLFVDINAEQKSVKRSLLQELYADLHRDAADPAKRTLGLISRSIMELDEDHASPFYGRILFSERARSAVRCISLTAVFSALDKPGLYFRSVRENVVVDPGPMWSAKDRETIDRTTTIMNGWFRAIQSRVPEWWDLGSAEGGGLSMNDGVTVCINVLRSVAEHLEGAGARLSDHSAREIVDRIRPYAEALGEHFGSLSLQERAEFRALRGVQGQTAGVRHAQKALQARFPAFQPEGLSEFLERERAQTNDKADLLVKAIERILARVVIGTLRVHYGVDGEAWWYDGVPKTVRAAATALQEEDQNRRGGKERYLNFIDYRDIIVKRENWPLFETVLGRGKGNLSREKRTDWIVRANETRKVAAHASSATWVSFEQLYELRELVTWLSEQTGSAQEVEEELRSASVDESTE